MKRLQRQVRGVVRAPIFTLSTIAILLCASQASAAIYSEHVVKNPPPPQKPATKWSAPKSKSDFRVGEGLAYRFHAGIGGRAYFFDLPSIEPAWTSTSVSSAPLVTSRFDSIRFAPTFEFGVHFNNGDGESLWSRIWGQTSDITLSGMYVNSASKFYRSGIASATIWTVDGSGFQVANVPSGYAAVNNRVKMYDLHTRYIGHNQLNRWLTMSPSVGVVYSDYRNYMVATMQYETNFAGHPDAVTVYDKERYSIDSRLYGISFGNRLDFRLTDHISPFIGAELEFLHASSHFSVRQTTSIGGPNPQSYSAKDNLNSNFTYRAILQVGSKFSFNTDAASPYIELTGALDYWGWTPQVVVPHGTNDTQPAHLKKGSSLNPYVGVNFVYPF
jgi:hypothetical protein